MLDRLFRRGVEPPDGAVPALESIATGISPALLSPEAAASPATSSVAGRRDRLPESGADALTDAVAQKLLHAWLQNRHQTLFPLSLNFRVLSPVQRAAVMRGLAALLHAGRPAAAVEDAVPALRDWLRGVGADTAADAQFAEALARPPPLHEVMETAMAENVAVYVYVAGLAASDPRFPASLRLLDVLQARFDLPSNVVRSASRRYRR